MKIFLDAGHNYSGYDTGAQGNGLREQDVTFYVAQETGRALQSAGISVRYSRNALTDNVGTDVSSSIMQRCAMANQWGADFFVSIHCNASTNPSANGTETLIYAQSSRATVLAAKINGALSALGLSDRGVKVRTDLGVLRYTAMPALLVELAFISNASDAAFLEKRRGELARAVAGGILEYAGLAPVAGEHWALKYYDFLTAQGIEILEKRFDDPVTRGEVFKLLALLKGYRS